MVDASRTMAIDVLVNEPRVVHEAVELCKWFVFQENVYNITKEYMANMCLRDDVFDIEMWILACGAFDALKGEGETEQLSPVRTAMMKEGMKCATATKVGEAAQNQYMVFPVIDTLTLGLYGIVNPGTGTFAMEKENLTTESEKMT